MTCNVVAQCERARDHFNRSLSIDDSSGDPSQAAGDRKDGQVYNEDVGTAAAGEDEERGVIDAAAVAIGNVIKIRDYTTVVGILSGW